MKEHILKILMDVSKGEQTPEMAQGDLLDLIRGIKKFDFDATALTIEEQVRLRMIMSTGKVSVKVVLEP